MNKIWVLIGTTLLGLASNSTVAEDITSDVTEIGILEERCSPDPEGMSNAEEFHTGVRPVFYRADNRWNSYQEQFDIGSEDSGKKTSSEFARQRQWHFAHGGEKRVLKSEATEELPRSLWFAVQSIVEGSDAVPQTERSHAYVWWNGVPVRPQIAVSSLKQVAITPMLSESRVVRGDAIPEPVLLAGYEYLQSRLGGSWPCDAPHEDCPGYNAEVESVLKVATRYNIKRESLILYDFHEVEQPNYQPMSIAPMICEDQISGELWHLRDGLKFIAAGDFDSDGEWEYLFWIDAYNENGYLLASEKFRHFASYTWRYH